MRNALAIRSFVAGAAAALLITGAGSLLAQAPPPVPALPDASRINTQVLAGSICTCALGFNLYGDGTDIDNWVHVYLGGTRYLSTDPTHGWTLTSVTGSLGTIPRPITDAVFAFSSPQTGTLVVFGAQRPRRLSEFSEARGIPARDHNQVLNTIFAELREAWDNVAGTVRGQPGETIARMPSAAGRASQVIGFDATGTIPLMYPVTPSGIIAVSSVSNVDASLTISPTAGNVVASLNQGSPNVWTAAQQFNAGARIKGSSTGYTTIATANAGASNFTWTLPAVNDTPAGLGTADQTLTGGANVTSLSLTTGNITIDCGSRPLQYITNGGAFTITAPANDGSCMILVTNNASAGAITMSGFTVGSSTGAALTATNGNKFTLSVWRINGTAGYSWFAHQ